MTQQPESVDWFAACREASAYAFTLKAELRSVEEKNRLLHQRHHDDNVEYMRVLTQRDALLEALKLAWPIIEAEKYKQDCSYGKNFVQTKADRARSVYDKARAAIEAVEGEKK